jgi:hypothetical protein
MNMSKELPETLPLVAASLLVRDADWRVAVVSLGVTGLLGVVRLLRETLWTFVVVVLPRARRRPAGGRHG